MILIPSPVACEIFTLNAATLQFWVRSGWVKPIVMGQRAHAAASMFSPLQCVAIASAAGLIEKWGTAGTYMRDTAAKIPRRYVAADEEQFVKVLLGGKPWLERMVETEPAEPEFARPRFGPSPADRPIPLVQRVAPLPAPAL
jgi:hypothetical protein